MITKKRTSNASYNAQQQKSVEWRMKKKRTQFFHEISFSAFSPCSSSVRLRVFAIFTCVIVLNIFFQCSFLLFSVLYFFFLYLYLNILLKICFFRPEFAVWLVRKFVRVLFFTLRFAFGAFTVIRLKCSYLQHFARWHRWCARARCLCVRNENRVHTHTRIRAQFQCTLSRTHWCTHQWQILLNEKCAIFTLARDLCDCMIIIVFSTVRLFPTQQLHQRTHDEEKKNHTHSEWEETMKQKIQKLNARNGRKKAHEWNRIYDIASLILCAKREKEMNLNRIVARCVWRYCVCLTLWLQCITPYHQYS